MKWTLLIAAALLVINMVAFVYKTKGAGRGNKKYVREWHRCLRI